MRSLCFLLGLLFLTAKAATEKEEEYRGVSFQEEEMEPGREMKEEQSGEAVQLLLNENGPQDFLLATLAEGQNRKLIFKRCSCRKNCPTEMRRGFCSVSSLKHLCCSS